MSALRLRLLSPSQQTKDVPLTQLLVVPAERGVTYSIIDAATQKPVSGIVLKKKGDALVVEVDEQPVVQIEHFYADDQGAAFDVGPAASGEAQLITASDAASQVSGVVWPAGDNGMAAMPLEAGADANGAMLWGGGLLGGGGLLAAAGGGGGGGAAAVAAVNNIVSGAIVGGPVIDGHGLSVHLYKADGTLLGTATVDASGRYSYNVGAYTGVVIAEVVDGNDGDDYLDETTNLGKDLNAELFGAGVLTTPNSTLQLNLNVLTSAAYHKAVEAAGGNPLDATIVSNTNAAIAQAFGLPDLHSVVVVTTNGSTTYDLSDGVSAGEVYGTLLAALSGADALRGGDSQASLDALLAGISLTGSTATLDAAAQELVISGGYRANANAQAETSLVVDTIAPAFTSGAVATAINENSGAGQVVYTAQAADASRLSYSLKPGTGDASAFSIDASSGAVALVGNPNFESKSAYSFTVVATDAAGNASEQAVSLSVNDLDEVAPAAPSIDVVATDDLINAAEQGAVISGSAEANATVSLSIGGNLRTVSANGSGVWSYSLVAADIVAMGQGAETLSATATDAAGNVSAAGTRDVSVDTDAPTQTVSTVSLSADTGTSASDFVTKTASQTISASLSDVLEAGDILYGSVDNGSTWTDITSKVSGTAISWDGATLAGSSNILFKVVDAAGNQGASSGSTAYVLDTTAPTAPSVIASVQLEAIDKVNGDDKAPQITAVGNDGAFVVTWSGYDIGDDYSIFVQRFNADGTATGNAPVQLEPIGKTSGNDFNPQVSAVGSAGAFVVTWSGVDSNGDSSIFVQRFDTNGDAVNDPVQLEPIGKTNGDDKSPQVTAVGSAGAFVVAWYGQDSDGDDSIFVQRFDTNGDPVNDPVQLEPIGKADGADQFPQITAVGSEGAFVVTWSGVDSNGDNSIFVQRFNADGTTTNNTPVQLEAIGTTNGFDINPQVTAVGSLGAFVVSWSGQDSGGDFSIFVQRFNANGTTSGTSVKLEAIDVNYEDDDRPQISALGSAGAFVVTWYGLDSEGDLSIFVQRFNADGTTSSNVPVQLEAIGKTDGHDFNPQVSAVGSDGAFVVTWQGMDREGDQSIFVQRFNADGTTTGNAPVQLEAIGKTDGHDVIPQVSAVGSDGAFVVTWQGKDREGDQSIFVQRFNADGTPSTVVLINASTFDTATVTVQSSETGTAYLVHSSVTVTDLASITGAAGNLWNSAVVSAANSDTAIAAAGLADGSYSVYAEDQAGNLSLQASGITIDTVVPNAPSINAVATDDIINAAEQGAVISGSAQANATVSLSIGGNLRTVSANGSGVWSYSLVPADIVAMGQGAETLSVTATDAAGNVSAAGTRNVSVDTVAPNAPSIDVVAGDNIINAAEQGAVISGSAEANATVSLSIAGNVRTVSANGSGVWSYSLVPADIVAMGQGTETLSVTVTDAVGNVSEAGTRSVSVDTVAPTATVTAATIESICHARVKSSEVGTAYLVSSSIVVNSLSDITSATDDQWNSVAITTANSTTGLAATGLAAGEYRVYTADAAGNLSAASSNAVTITSPFSGNTSIVVFDLVNGVSSSHSCRSFSADVDYTIYIRVKSSTADVYTVPQAGALAAATWGMWNGGNLDAGDKIILVGDSPNDVIGAYSSPINRYVGNSNNVTWGTGAVQFAGNAARLTKHNGLFHRTQRSDQNAVPLYYRLSSLPSIPFANHPLTQVYLKTMPVNVMTTQGLA